MMDLLLPVNGQSLLFYLFYSALEHPPNSPSGEAERKPLQPAELHEVTISFRWDFSVHCDFWLLFFILRSSKVKHFKKISEVEPNQCKNLAVFTSLKGMRKSRPFTLSVTQNRPEVVTQVSRKGQFTHYSARFPSSGKHRVTFSFVTLHFVLSKAWFELQTALIPHSGNSDLKHCLWLPFAEVLAASRPAKLGQAPQTRAKFLSASKKCSWYSQSYTFPASKLD